MGLDSWRAHPGRIVDGTSHDHFDCQTDAVIAAQLSGAQTVHSMDSIGIPFDEYSARVQKHLEDVYGIRIVTRDIPDPLTGDLDGAEIDIDYAVSPEQRLFLLAHLFGHTVQWNVNPALFEIGRRYEPPVNEHLIPAVIAYEREAAGYALTMSTMRSA